MEIRLALQALRTALKEAKKEYRYADDVSPSLFHPGKGFVEAYDKQTVDNALAELERALSISNSNQSAEGPTFIANFNFVVAPMYMQR